MSQEPEELLAKRSLLNRFLYQQKIVEAVEEQQQSTKYIGFDASTGMGRLKDATGNVIFGNSITNGVIALGDTVRMRGNRYDAMPSYKQETKVKEKTATEPKPVNVQILYFVWDDGYFNWYVGGDREIPLLLYSEPDEEVFPPTGQNTPVGIYYTEYEAANISNLNKGKFSAIFEKTYAPDGIANAITDNYRYFYDFDNSVWVQSTNTSIRFYKQSYVKNNPDNISDYTFNFEYRASSGKFWRYLGNGYAISQIHLFTRLYFRNYIYASPTYPERIEIPSEYLCYLAYLEPTDNDGSQQVVVPITYSTNAYSYTLPIADTGGSLPLKNKTTTFSATLSDYTYEGEHYLNIGKDGYITEYINKSSANNITREIRFYKNKKFVCNLNTNTAFGFCHDTFNNGGYTSNYANDIQLQRYQKDDFVTITSGRNQLVANQDFALALTNSQVKLFSIHYQTYEIYTVKAIVDEVTINGFGAIVVTVQLLEEPQIITYSSSCVGIYGYFGSAFQGILKYESGSYYDFAINSTDVAFGTNSRFFDNNYLGAYNYTTVLAPFSTTDPDYLHNLIVNNQLNYEIYYQNTFFVDTFNGRQYDNNLIISNLSSFRYLDNNFTKLYGNKLYRFNILFDDADANKNTVAGSISEPSTNLDSIRSEQGKDERATCYIEIWKINEKTGSVTREKILTLPVYGLYTQDINWYFSDILDMDIGFNK